MSKFYLKKSYVNVHICVDDYHENVKNEDTLVPEKPFTIIDTRFDEDDPQRNVIVPLATENLTYTASMESIPTQSISTVNFRCNIISLTFTFLKRVYDIII